MQALSLNPNYRVVGKNGAIFMTQKNAACFSSMRGQSTIYRQLAWQRGMEAQPVDADAFWRKPIKDRSKGQLLEMYGDVPSQLVLEDESAKWFAAMPDWYQALFPEAFPGVHVDGVTVNIEDRKNREVLSYLACLRHPSEDRVLRACVDYFPRLWEAIDAVRGDKPPMSAAEKLLMMVCLEVMQVPKKDDGDPLQPPAHMVKWNYSYNRFNTNHTPMDGSFTAQTLKEMRNGRPFSNPDYHSEDMTLYGGYEGGFDKAYKSVAEEQKRIWVKSALTGKEIEKNVTDDEDDDDCWDRELVEGGWSPLCDFAKAYDALLSDVK